MAVSVKEADDPTDKPPFEVASTSPYNNEPMLSITDPLNFLAALVAGLIIDKNFFTLLLSYCPGGIYEVAVIAIFFDLDPEFVSFHHLIRLLMILFVVPIMLKIISKKSLI